MLMMHKCYYCFAYVFNDKLYMRLTNLPTGASFSLITAWYHMTQGSFCIGTVACLAALGILVHNVYGKELKMTSTVYTAAVCVLGISGNNHYITLKSIAVYTCI